MKNLLKRVNGWSVIFWLLAVYIAIGAYSGDTPIERSVGAVTALMMAVGIYYIGQFSAERAAEISNQADDVEIEDFWNWF